MWTCASEVFLEWWRRSALMVVFEGVSDFRRGLQEGGQRRAEEACPGRVRVSQSPPHSPSKAFHGPSAKLLRFFFRQGRPPAVRNAGTIGTREVGWQQEGA